MSDLISRSALLKSFKMRCQGNCKRCVHSTFLASDEHCGLIDEAPTVEVNPVVHGEWVHGYNCSECGFSYMDYADADSYPASGNPLPNFCGNCGADMRKKVPR